MLCPRCKKPLRVTDSRKEASNASRTYLGSEPFIRNVSVTMVVRRRRCDLCQIDVFTEEHITHWKKTKPMNRAKPLRRKVWPPKEVPHGNK